MSEKPEETKVTQLSPNRLMLSEHAHQTWVASPETGTPPEALLDPKCWAHYSVNPNMQMKPGDLILVKPEDGTFFQELLVREVFRGGIKVLQLRLVNLDKVESVRPAPEVASDPSRRQARAGVRPRKPGRRCVLAERAQEGPGGLKEFPWHPSCPSTTRRCSRSGSAS
jgi:hypothetical protein